VEVAVIGVVWWVVKERIDLKGCWWRTEEEQCRGQR